jgi:hypothetical protein
MGLMSTGDFEGKAGIGSAYEARNANYPTLPPAATQAQEMRRFVARRVRFYIDN